VGEVELGARPGTVHLLDWSEVPLGGDGGARRGHALRVTMEAARMRDRARAPRRAFLVGVETRGPAGGGGGPDPIVASEVAGAARVALDLLHGLAELDGPGLQDVSAIALFEPARVNPRATATPPPLPVAAT
jgi:hypothetical protein